MGVGKWILFLYFARSRWWDIFLVLINFNSHTWKTNGTSFCMFAVELIESFLTILITQQVCGITYLSRCVARFARNNLAWLEYHVSSYVARFARNSIFCQIKLNASNQNFSSISFSLPLLFSWGLKPNDDDVAWCILGCSSSPSLESSEVDSFGDAEVFLPRQFLKHVVVRIALQDVVLNKQQNVVHHGDEHARSLQQHQVDHHKILTQITPICHIIWIVLE